MIPYPDGTEASIGDSVALAYGTHAGAVTHIIESAADIDSWNLDGPGLMIATSRRGMTHHFCQNTHSP
jgi:hypothetical protein